MARFHFVVTGKCCLRTSINEWIPQSAGDVVLLPLGRGHALADAAQGPTKPLEDFPLEEIGERTFELRGGGGGPKTILACCSVSFEEPSVYPLLELMPVHLLVRSAAQKDASLSALIEVMGSEVTGHRVGSATIMTRLADVVIARIVREWVDTREQDTTGWLAAIRDPKIGRTLAAIHRRLGHPWSVDSLAKVAQSSRSMLSERFTSVVGVSVGQYLTRWRMHVAGTWLKDKRLTVSETAARLGYESEASFSRAFKRVLGVPPSALRSLRQKDA